MTETESKLAEYTDHLTRNEKASKEISQLMRDMTRLKEIISNWTQKKLQNSKDCKERNEKLMQEKITILKHYHDLKRKMTIFRQEEAKRLSNLTKNSKACMDTLKSYQKLSKKILKTAELCRKLETEREKVLPFYEAETDAVEDEPEYKLDKIDGLDKAVYNEFQTLDNFYKRYNKVLLDKVAIDKQKASLEKENMFFKSLLKQYLDGVSVNNDVMNSSNPLLVVNNKVNLNRPPVHRLDGSNQKTLIEGNMEITNIAMQMKR